VRQRDWVQWFASLDGKPFVPTMLAAAAGTVMPGIVVFRLIQSLRTYADLSEGEVTACCVIAALALSTPSTFLFAAGLQLPPRPDGDTRCRKCNYVLRGISELRCPECGERICRLV